jgi:ERCC4-type nuclease
MSNIIVHIDFRETELYELVKGMEGATVDSISLEVGDIMICNGEEPLLVLERKTFADLASSNRDGRYREQRARLLSMRGQGIVIGYLLEVGGGWSADLGRVWPGKIPETTLASLVLRLQLRYGIPVVESKDANVSAALIRQLVRMVAADVDVFKSVATGDATAVAAAYTEVLSAQKSANRNLKRVAAGMLCAVPGCGGKMSESIMDACGTLADLVAKSQAEIAALNVGKRTVGKVLAEKIWNALHSK